MSERFIGSKQVRAAAYARWNWNPARVGRRILYGEWYAQFCLMNGIPLPEPADVIQFPVKIEPEDLVA